MMCARAPSLLALLVLGLAAVAGCGSRAHVLLGPHRVESFCGSYAPRISALLSVLSSTADRPASDGAPAFPAIRAEVRREGGLIAYWNDELPLMLPQTAARFGETDEYVRVKAAAVGNAPPGAHIRRIELFVRDHGRYRWGPFDAFDVQSVCVEGSRQL